jgi:hypothetical protein
MSEIEIIDDFLEEEKFNKLYDYMTSGALPWTLGNGVIDTTNDTVICDDKYNFQFVHMFYHTPCDISPQGEILDDLLEKIDPTVLVRIKANLNPVTDEIIEHGFHIDIQPGQMANITTTAIFYLNTNNGYTLFEDGTRISNIANRFVSFPGYMRHTGTTCTDQRYRLILNMNYIKCENNNA